MFRQTCIGLLTSVAIACRERTCFGHGAHDLLGGMGSGELSAGTRQRVRAGDRRQGNRRNDGLAGLPDQGLRRI